MLDIIESYIQDGIGLVQLAGLLVVCVVVVATWTRTKSAMATVAMMVLGALVLGFLHNAEWFGRKAAEDLQQRENGAEVVPR